MFKELEGKIITQVDEYAAECVFHLSTGEQYKMWHDQDCCEYVRLESVDQPWETIYGSPVLLAEERTNTKETSDGRCTHTFYTIRTVQGTVNIRWIGESNGFYSESVDFEKIKDADKTIANEI